MAITSSSIMVSAARAALLAAGCSRSASTDKTKEAPRVTVAHPVVRSLMDEDDYNGWLEASQDGRGACPGAGAHPEDRISRTATW